MFPHLKIKKKHNNLSILVMDDYDDLEQNQNYFPTLDHPPDEGPHVCNHLHNANVEWLSNTENKNTHTC